MKVNVFYFWLFLALGAAFSYDDWRRQKVRNTWVLFSLGMCALGFSFLLLNSLLGRWEIGFLGLGEFFLPISFYFSSALHFALIAGAGLLVWRIGIWPAGDAKLYMVFGLLAVLIDQNIKGFPFLLFLKLLINIFVPAGLWVLAVVSLLLLVIGCLRLPLLRGADVRRTLIAGFDRLVIRVMDHWPHKWKMAVFSLNMFALFLAMEIGTLRINDLEIMKSGMGPLLMLLFLYVVWNPISDFLQKRGTLAVWGVLGLLLYFDPQVRAAGLKTVLFDSVKMMVSFGFLSGLLRWLVVLHLRRMSERRVGLGDLKPGMILSEESWETVKELGAEDDEALRRRYADGLFSEDVVKIKSWSEVPDLMLTAYRAMPFALWVFGGTLFTMASSRNVVYWLMKAVSSPHELVEAVRRAWGA